MVSTLAVLSRPLWSSRRSDQDGVALLTVLLVTGLITIMAVAMLNRQQIEIRRTGNIMAADQALALARGGENWAIRLLLRDQKKSSADHLGEEWARGLPPIPVEGGAVSGNIVDLQGRFNINNLLAADSGLRDTSRGQFQRLLRLCQIEPESLDGVVDWLDDDGEEGWAEDWAYAGLDTPYRTANQPMQSPSELRQVQGMSARGFQCLEPLIATLPAGTLLNINTAPAEILAALAEEVSLLQAQNIVTARPLEGYAHLAGFLAVPELAGTGLTAEGLTLSSTFFLVQSRATMGRGKSTLLSILQRHEDGINVLRRTMGAS
jgi:general secretion pathway protein K